MTVTVLDGGMGQELIRRSGKPATPLWSTQALLDAPDLVAGLHADYAAAGADVVTTNTYALHRDRLRPQGNHYAAQDTVAPDLESRFGELMAAALDAAQTVRPGAQIAGAIGPLRASYRPDLHPPHDEAVAAYGEVAGMLAPRCDILLFETIPSLAAARACLEAGRAHPGAKLWLAFTVDDEDGSLLRSGEPVAEAARIGAEADAVLANCAAPEAMPRALNALAGSGVAFGAYANAFTQITKAFLSGGTTADDLKGRRDLTPETYADHAMAWADQGATILGGCCETNPAHIAAIAARLGRQKGAP